MDPKTLESHHSFPVFVVQDGRPKTRLERVLSLCADVRAGEGANALLMALNGFLLLTSYYLLKTVRQALILGQSGPEKAAYTSAGTALLLLFLVPVYGAIASRVVRVKLISWVTLFFTSHLIVFASLDRSGVRVGVAFYVWLAIFNMLLVGQFWAFANDLYDEHKGKRLFPLVGIGTAAGGVIGAGSATLLFKALGAHGLMLVAGVILLLGIGVTLIVNRRESGIVGSIQHRIAAQPVGREGGFQLLLTDRYLFLIASAILLLNLVNSNGEYLMNKLADSQATATIDAQRMAFFADFAGKFNMIQNTLVLILQMFVVSRIFRHIGVGAALFILPVIALGGYALAFALPVLGILKSVKVLENSTDYSINNTARSALFLPTSREAKYKAKNAIDTFVARTGDMFSGILVLVGGLPLLTWNVRDFAVINVLLVLLWLAVVAAIVREHKKLSPAIS